MELVSLAMVRAVAVVAVVGVRNGLEVQIVSVYSEVDYLLFYPCLLVLVRRN